ncbi:MAG: hypothetical protein DRP60_00565 [Spirochaetes bacterium]|nr:MAG: hypothetical protein DRP60_00565 [Spirochaetota bacterium]
MSMLPDPLLETNGNVDSLNLERALFIRRSFTWRETNRRFTARYSWNGNGQLASIEIAGEVFLFAYDDTGNKIACYRLDSSGEMISRENWKWDEQNRVSRRILTTPEFSEEKEYIYEHDDAGRMSAERIGNKIRVEKYDLQGRFEQEYLYDGEKPDLVTDYKYDDENHLLSITVKNPEGSHHRRTLFTYDAEDRVASEMIFNAEDRIIKDEVYAYGASQGKRWLERVTWIPLGKKRGKRRPSEVIYRSFTLGGNQSRSAPGTPESAAFENGVYTGPLVGGLPEGEGVFQYNDSSRYQGEFRNGSMDGYGSLSWPDGRVMEGQFRNGLLEGTGFCIWADGSRFDGEFQNGRMHGPGIFLWADGTRFEGLFKDGKRTSQGAWEKPGDSSGNS